MIASRQVIAHWFSRAVRQEQTRVIAEHCIAYRRFNTHTCRAPGNDQILNPQLPQSCVQTGLVESAVAMLGDDDVLRRR
jgi:hypothetical protein